MFDAFPAWASLVYVVLPVGTPHVMMLASLSAPTKTRNSLAAVEEYALAVREPFAAIVPVLVTKAPPSSIAVVFPASSPDTSWMTRLYDWLPPVAVAVSVGLVPTSPAGVSIAQILSSPLAWSALLNTDTSLVMALSAPSLIAVTSGLLPPPQVMYAISLVPDETLFR
jgi:hypothetical protein